MRQVTLLSNLELKVRKKSERQQVRVKQHSGSGATRAARCCVTGGVSSADCYVGRRIFLLFREGERAVRRRRRYALSCTRRRRASSNYAVCRRRVGVGGDGRAAGGIGSRGERRECCRVGTLGRPDRLRFRG